MRPRPSETIAGVRKILRDTIAPELSSEHARARLSEIGSVLAVVDWDNAGFELMRKCAALAAAVDPSGTRTDVLVPTAPEALVYAEFEIYHDALAAIAVDDLARLRAILVETPDDADAAHRVEVLLRCVGSA